MLIWYGPNIRLLLSLVLTISCWEECNIYNSSSVATSALHMLNVFLQRPQQIFFSHTNCLSKSVFLGIIWKTHIFMHDREPHERVLFSSLPFSIINAQNFMVPMKWAEISWTHKTIGIFTSELPEKSRFQKIQRYTFRKIQRLTSLTPPPPPTS